MKFHTFGFIKPFTSIAVCFMAVAIFSQKVDIEFNTSMIGGHHAPKNALVVWIQNTNSEYVRSVNLWGCEPSYMLKNWRIAMGLADTGFFDSSVFDGVTAATRFTHDEKISVSWDLTDKDGNEVSDGTYQVWLEMSDEDYWWGMSDPNEVYPGKFITTHFNLEKSGTATNHAVTSPQPYFSNYSLTFPGSIVAIKESDKLSMVKGRMHCFYNRGSQLVIIKPDLPSGQSALLYITNLKGKTIEKISLSHQQDKIYWNLKTSKGHRVPSGVYLFEIRALETNIPIGNTQSITLVY